LVKGFTPDPDTLAQANEEGIPILGSKEQAFELSAKIYNLIN
jgi:serine kinase of HPr protein (carbohydrate metabolism regulator)